MSPVPHKTPSRVSRLVESLPPSGIRKFFDLVIGREDIVSLGVGEPDFATPWRICEAAVYAIERGQTSYTSNRGLIAARNAIADYLQNRFGVEYHPATDVCITVGVSQGIDITLRAIVNPGDEVIVIEPCYVAYRPMALLAGAEVRILPTFMRDGFQPDLERLESLVTPRTKALFLCNPNNPTGTTYARATLEGIADIVRRHDLIVLSDEVYAELTYEGEHVCFPTLDGMRERTVLLSGFSKAWAMTGWRLGYIAGPRDIIEMAVKVHQYSMMCAPIMAQYAAIEALKNGRRDVDDMVAAYDERRRVITNGLRAIGLPCILPAGAFYVFPSIAHTGMTSEQFCTELLNQTNVAVVPGNAFGESGEGHVRCAYAASLEQIRTALDRMGDFIGALRPLKNHALAQ
ncbi:MAG: aminotransferase class I/II-fold pyridoxal phosphate-dependent enzyme [Candidatus Sumerlaeia bacterium]|nr:aminotransferase class I/II-fold pyridoxal phosphate-dependent enzyme [Candidatus Sumerlaeia bacterium]